MKTMRVLFLGILILASGVVGAKEDVQFKFEPVTEGSLVQLSVQSDLRFYSGNLRASARRMAEMFVLKITSGAVTQVKLSYGDCSTEGTLTGFANDKSPVEGKVYLVERAGDKLVVKNALGDAPAAEEVAIVEKDVELLGRPHPIAVMLNGQRLNIGQKLVGKDVLRQVLEERLEPYKIGKVKTLDAVLSTLSEYNKEKTAVFAFRVETGESTVAYDSKFELTGQLIVSRETGRPIAIRLDGPVNAKVKADAPKEELRGKSLRGTFSLVVITQTIQGEREKVQHTDHDDWRVVARPIHRPRPTPRR